MSQNLQLHILTPCHENWASMQPAEQGRHCAAYQKTVVDFTAMTDEEIIRHIAKASSNVCGRFMPDQMNRNLAPLTPAQRNGGSGWRWLLTGLLITSKIPEPIHSIKPPAHEQRMPPKDSATQDYIVGAFGFVEYKTIPEVPPPEQPSTLTADTDHIVLGTIAAIIPDSDSTAMPSLDTALLSKTHSSCGPEELSGMVGGISVGIPITRIDSFRQMITDTLVALHLLPKKELTIYPNPARRGNPISLSWRSAEPGEYQVTLFSSTGALIQEKILQVINSEQVDLLNIPASMATGVYFLRAIRAGQAKPYTQQLLVE